MAYKITIDGVDASGYVIGSQKIPITERNRNLSLVAGEFELQVLSSFGAVTAGEEVRFYENTTTTYPKFVGEITSIKPNIVYGTDSILILRVRHIWYKMMDYKLTSTNLNSLISGGGVNDYKSSDGTGPVVKALYLMSRMFTVTGYDLTFQTGVDSEVSASRLWGERIRVGTLTSGRYYIVKKGTVDGHTVGSIFVSDGTETVDNNNYVAYADSLQYYIGGATLQSKFIYIKDICLDENMIYVINQDYASNDTPIGQTIDEVEKIKTFWDLFSVLCFSLQLVPIINTSGTAADWTLSYHSDTEYTPSSDNIDEKSAGVLQATGGGYTAKMWTNIQRTTYQDSTKDTLVANDEISDPAGLSNNTIDWFNNLYLAHRDKTADFTELTLYNPGGKDFTDEDLHFLPLSEALERDISIIDNNYTQNIYTTAAVLNIQSQMNYIGLDLFNEQTELRQEFI